MSRSATLRADPVVVQPRWLLHVGLLLLTVAMIVVMVVVRRDDELEFEDRLWTAALLVLGLWLFGLGLASLVRNVRAGHGLRLDHEGMHVPGLAVVPWASIERVDLRGYGSGGKRFPQLVVHTDALRGRPSLRHYERYLFGPATALTGRGGTALVPIGLLAIEPEVLLATARSFLEIAGARAQVRGNVQASVLERGTLGRRLP
ncbi:MAG: hypothetical protein ABI745_05235 [Caldimonas sp.]